MFTVTQAAAKIAGATSARRLARRIAFGIAVLLRRNIGSSFFTCRRNRAYAAKHFRERDDLRMNDNADRRRQMTSLDEILPALFRFDAANLEHVVVQPTPCAECRVTVAVDHL